MIRGIIRFIPWWALILLFGFILAWTFRVNIAERVLSQIFHVFNIENSEIELKEIDTSRVWFGKSRFTLSSDDRVFETELVNTKAFYDLDNLYTGKINKVEIEQATISVHSQVGSQDKELDFVKILEAITTLLSEEFPVTTVTINNLIFHDGSEVLSKHSPISLQIESISASTHLQVTHPQWKAFAHKTPSQFTVSLEDDSGNSIINLDSKIRQTGSGQKSVTVDLETEAELLMAWWHEPTALANLQGLLNIDIDFEISENNATLIEFEIAADKLTNTNLLVTQLDASGGLALPRRIYFKKLESIHFSQLKVSMKEIKSDDFSIYEPKITSKGLAKLTDNELLIDLSPNTVVKFDELQAPLVSIKNGVFSSGIAYSLHKQIHSVQLLKGGSFQSNNLKIESFNASDMDINITDNIQLQVSSHKNGIEWRVPSGKIKYQNADLSINEFTAKASSINLDLENISPTTATVEIQSSQIQIDFDGQALPLESLNLRMVKTGSNLENTGSFSISEIPVPYQFEATTDTQKNDTKFELHQQSMLDLSLYGNDIKSLISPFKLETLDFTNGEGTLGIEGEWSSIDGISIKASPLFSNLSGKYEDFEFHGGSIEGLVIFPPTPNSAVSSAHVNIGRIDLGVSIENLDFDINLVNTANETTTAFEIRNFQGSILGSEVSGGNFIFDPSLDTNFMGLTVTGLDIEAVVQLQEIEGLSATGKLDGYLPVEIHEQGVRISAGQLHNQKSGGKISYQVEDNLKQSLSNPLTDAALNALSDFNYDILTAEIDYEPTGDLMVNFHIEGTSPHLENNQPVHLNINTEQNVLSLLESLKYANSLNDKFDKSLQKGIPSAN